MTHEEMLEEAERREKEVQQNIERAVQIDKEIEEDSKPFYRFFAIEYFATGEGMSFWLKVCRNYDLHDGKDYDLERFVKFIGVGAEHYIQGLSMLI
jgi:hypothetical protein